MIVCHNKGASVFVAGVEFGPGRTELSLEDYEKAKARTTGSGRSYLQGWIDCGRLRFEYPEVELVDPPVLEEPELEAKPEPAPVKKKRGRPRKKPVEE